MARRMPVLRREGELERMLQQPVDRCHDGVAVGDGKLAAGHEGRLHVDQAEYVGCGIDDEAHAATAFFGGLAAGGAGTLSG